MRQIVHGRIDGRRIECVCRDSEDARFVTWYLNLRFRGCGVRLKTTPECAYVYIHAWPLYALALLLGAAIAIL